MRIWKIRLNCSYLHFLHTLILFLVSGCPGSGTTSITSSSKIYQNIKTNEKIKACLYNLDLKEKRLIQSVEKEHQYCALKFLFMQKQHLRDSLTLALFHKQYAEHCHLIIHAVSLYKVHILSQMYSFHGKSYYMYLEFKSLDQGVLINKVRGTTL